MLTLVQTPAAQTEKIVSVSAKRRGRGNECSRLPLSANPVIYTRVCKQRHTQREMEANR